MSFTLSPVSPGTSLPFWVVILCLVSSCLVLYWCFPRCCLRSSFLITYCPRQISSAPIASVLPYKLMTPKSVPWSPPECHFHIHLWIFHRYLKICVPPNPSPCLCHLFLVLTCHIAIHQASWTKWRRLTLDSDSLFPQKVVPTRPEEPSFVAFLALAASPSQPALGPHSCCQHLESGPVSPLCLQIHIANLQQALNSNRADCELLGPVDKPPSSFVWHSKLFTLSSHRGFQPAPFMTLCAFVLLPFLANLAGLVESSLLFRI